MVTAAAQKFEIRLAPKEGEPDALVFDDIIRLIQQAVVTASPQIKVPSIRGEFVRSSEENQPSVRQLDSSIKHRIEQASADSRKLVEAREEIAQQPNSEPQLAQESLDAAANLIAAVQRAMIRGLRISIPEVGE